MEKKYYISNAGNFILNGKDAVDFLNRISTNDFRNFKDGEFRKTLLLDVKGRIIDLIYVLKCSDNLCIYCTIENKNKVIDYINKYIISDDVVIINKTENIECIKIFGYEKEVIFDEMNGNELLLNANYVKLKDDLTIINDENILFVYGNAITENIKANIQNSFSKMNENEYESHRVDNLLFNSVKELNEDINPLELGLNKYISFEKGCYLGQEVIARMDSQSKLSKQVVKFESNVTLQYKEKIYTVHLETPSMQAKEKIYTERNSDKTECGFVTTVAPDKNIFKGFCFIKSSSLNFDDKYFTMNAGERNYIDLYKII